MNKAFHKSDLVGHFTKADLGAVGDEDVLRVGLAVQVGGQALHVGGVQRRVYLVKVVQRQRGHLCRKVCGYACEV